VQRVPSPPCSPKLNAYAERWVRSAKDEAPSRLILFGERALRHALTEYVTDFHQERPHESQGNVVLLPAAPQSQRHTGLIYCHERLGGLLKYYRREAA
jgi:transposase InsO family protein